MLRGPVERGVGEARRFGEDFALVFFDVDGFKPLNNAHGRTRASSLSPAVQRPPDKRGARYGNDEFVVLMPRTPLVGGSTASSRGSGRSLPSLRRSSAASPSASAAGGQVTPPRRRRSSRFLETADRAMYVAKRQGKYRLFTAVAVSAMPRPDEKPIHRCKARVLVTSEPRTSSRRGHGANTRSLFTNPSTTVALVPSAMSHLIPRSPSELSSGLHTFGDGLFSPARLWRDACTA